jgi:hypothetical protein
MRRMRREQGERVQPMLGSSDPSGDGELSGTSGTTLSKVIEWTSASREASGGEKRSGGAVSNLETASRRYRA